MKVFAVLVLTGMFVVGCGVAGPSFKQAPDFTLPSFQGPAESITLSEFHSESPVLLIFWATWCPSCVKEVPLLNSWHEVYRETGFKIVAVNVEEPRKKIEEFQKKYPIQYPVAMDFDGELAAKYEVKGLPVVLFLAKGGEILYYGFSLPENADAFLRLLKRK